MMATAARRTRQVVDRLRTRTGVGWLACAMVLAAAWGLWLHRLGVIDLDEAASNEVMFARQPLPSVLFELPWTDQSPLSFVVLHFWRAWGEDAGAIKVLNLVLLTASLLVFYAVARRLCPPPRVAVGALVLAVLSPASLWVARNGRMYSLQLLLWMVSLLFMLRYSERRRPPDLAGFVIASVLAIYNHFIGFVSTATAVMWLVAEAVVESRRSPADERAAVRRRLVGPPVAAGLVVLVLVQPQVMRMLGLLQAPPAVVAGQALPGGLLPFLDATSWFWFMNAGWGPLEARAPALRAVYLASAYALFVMGLARGSARMRRLVVVTVLLPLVLIGLAGGHMDFRDRHLLYLLPLIWLAMVNGALGRDAVEGLTVPPAVARLALVLLAVVGAASAWLLYHKLPERYVEWTKLMDGLVQIHRPGMALYMAPDPLAGSATLIASRLDPALGITIRPLGPETRHDFLAEASEGRDFAFLVSPWSARDAEKAWRVDHLGRLGYRTLLLPVAGASAQVFTRDVPSFAAVTKLRAGPSSAEAVAWARSRARDPSRPRRPATALGRALVARVQADGTARESTFFTSQLGESGTWRLGAADGDTVEEAKVRAEDAEREMLIARPTGDSLLLIVFPAMPLADTLRLTCGGAAASPAERPGAVSAQVYVDADEAALATCPRGGWDETVVDTAHARGRTADVTVALSAVGVARAEVAFRLVPSGDASPMEAKAPPGAVMLSPARTLKDQLERLRVHRTGAAGFGRVDARFETVPRSAAEMHESTIRDGEGGLDARWEMGELPWDAVGLTRQRMAGELKSGLWAHPRDGTTLVIEADGVALGRVVEGFYGLTDFSVERASAARLSEPIGFRVFLDGRPVLTRQASRARGAKPFSVEMPAPGTGAGRLRIEIDAARDAWGHFVFDLWTR